MERLTERGANGQAWYRACINCKNGKYGDYCVNCENRIEHCNRLADYEDAEKQGQLFKMPFEIGQKIYIIMGDIAEMLVAGYEIFGDSQMLITAFVETPEILGGNLDVKDAGEKFFATHEEAEAKLKEIEDSNDN